jgi:hypothetical protein
VNPAPTNYRGDEGDFEKAGLTLAGAGAIVGRDGGVVGHFLRREWKI